MHFTVARDHTSWSLTYVLKGMVRQPRSFLSIFWFAWTSWRWRCCTGVGRFSSIMACSVVSIALDCCIWEPCLLEIECMFSVIIFGDLHVSIFKNTCRACATILWIIVAWCDLAAANGHIFGRQYDSIPMISSFEKLHRSWYDLILLRYLSPNDQNRWRSIIRRHTVSLLGKPC